MDATGANALDALVDRLGRDGVPSCCRACSRSRATCSGAWGCWPARRRGGRVFDTSEEAIEAARAGGGASDRGRTGRLTPAGVRRVTGARPERWDDGAEGPRGGGRCASRTGPTPAACWRTRCAITRAGRRGAGAAPRRRGGGGGGGPRAAAPLDLVIPRKVGHPDYPEYGIAAVAEVGDVVANETETSRVDRGWFERAVAAERAEAARRRVAYLGGRPAMDLAGRTAIVVDDGIATGLTMRAAVRDVRHRGAARVVVAVPVAPADAVADLRGSVDEVVTLLAPEAYEGAVGAYYRSFGQVGDDEVVRCLAGDDTTWAAP
jgi:putative phosphoribosyl transferase